MATPRTNPDLLALWRYIDGELAPSESAAVAEYVATPEGQVQLERLQHFTAAVSLALADAATSPAHPPLVSVDCPSAEAVIAYAAGALSGEVKEQLTQHLHRCDACLQDVIEHCMIDVLLPPGEEGSLPPDVQAQAEALWKPPLSRVVIQRLKTGLALAVDYLAAPLVAVQEMPSPQPILRSTGGEASPVAFQAQHESGVRLEGTVTQADDEQILLIKIRDAEQRPLAGKQVELRRQGQLVFSAETDAQGVLEVSGIKLDAETYEIECPAIQVALQIQMRP